MKMLLFVLCLGVLSSCGHPPFWEATNLEEGKEAVDYSIDVWQKMYDELCDGPRSENQKKIFIALASKIQDIYNVYDLANKLDYEAQVQLNDYIVEKMKNEHPELEKLALTLNIPCW